MGLLLNENTELELTNFGGNVVLFCVLIIFLIIQIYKLKG